MCTSATTPSKSKIMKLRNFTQDLLISLFGNMFEIFSSTFDGGSDVAFLLDSMNLISLLFKNLINSISESTVSYRLNICKKNYSYILKACFYTDRK